MTYIYSFRKRYIGDFLRIKILHKTPKGFLIGRGNVRVGLDVYFKHKKIGKIVDIFGPVNYPYVKIKPYKNIIPDFVYLKNKK